MYRLTFLLLLISTFLHSQSSKSQKTSSERWIIKLSETDYQSFSSYKKSTLYFKKISEHFHLVNLISDTPLDIGEVTSLTEKYNPLKIYQDQKLTQRGLIPDDFNYSSQWNMDVIGMPEVWEQITGGLTGTGDDIVVAVLDDGFQIDHVDFENNWFINTNEIPDDNLDNDNNGKIDDYIGYNVDTGTGFHNLLPHGTKVAGIIGAKGNNGRGVSGVNWNVKMLPISGVDFIGEIEEAMSYIVMMKKAYIDSNGERGANIVVSNLSAGIDRQFADHAPDWCEYYNLAGEVGILSVSAAPNTIVNVDEVGDLPSLCPSDYLIAVTSTDQNDLKVREAGYGPKNIDLGAPGQFVFTTDIPDSYGTIIGTSGSSPHVAGVAALLYSVGCEKFTDLLKTDPSAVALLVKDAILDGVDKNDFLEQTVSGGRLNAYNAFLNLVGWCNGVPLTSLSISDIATSRERIVVSYNTNEFHRHRIALHDMMGRLVYESEFQPFVFQDKEVVIDISTLSHLSAGQYVVTVTNDSHKVSEPIALFY